MGDATIYGHSIIHKFNLSSISDDINYEPKGTVLDDPTLGLDVLARRERWHLIQSLKERMTILLTTHYLEEAEALSDNIIIMSKGKLVVQGIAKDLIAQAQVKTFE